MRTLCAQAGALAVVLAVLLLIGRPLGPVPEAVGAPLAAPLVRSTTGPDPATILPTVNQFRADLGGSLNANVAGCFTNGRREINWDGVPDALSAPNNMPANFFNSNSPRGAVFSTAGTGFQVSAAPNNPTGTPLLFGNLNPTYPTLFQVFSTPRLFTQLGSNVTDVTFFVPGSTTPATVSGFGAVFTDVDVAGSTSIAYFDAGGNPLGVFQVPASAGNQTLSFVGVSFTAGERISRVRITSGTTAPGPNDAPPAVDIVVMDDFIYGEPQAPGACVLGVTPTPTATATAIPQANLAITGAVSPNAVAVGGRLTTTFTVTNGGPSTAAGVTVTAPLPANVTLVSATASQGTCTGTTPVICVLGSLPAGGTATVTIITAPTAAGAALSFQATVTSTTTDPTPANNTTAVAATVLAPPVIPPAVTPTPVAAVILVAPLPPPPPILPLLPPPFLAPPPPLMPPGMMGPMGPAGDNGMMQNGDMQQMMPGMQQMMPGMQQMMPGMQQQMQQNGDMPMAPLRPAATPTPTPTPQPSSSEPVSPPLRPVRPVDVPLMPATPPSPVYPVPSGSLTEEEPAALPSEGMSDPMLPALAEQP
jgi:uncharacterized repeat protein (TIGR01451 family)